ncbi:MAG TPA: GMC family oxidoreductase N-terminal domain-containing protein [Steroidobacteraceae bacterium]|nr:GMC family oxidoreductase N-terminal domain-containing protein [Steroidobacteraceae bacterium]
MADGERSYDFIVVGGGTAGCALAARLSEESSRTVCLLEAGGSGRSTYVDVPAAIVMAQRSPELNWSFQTQPQPHLNNRSIPVPRGRGLGGSGLINGMVYFRGHPRDYDDWAKAGARGWSFREVLPYFCRSENNENFGHSPYHGRGGPMNVRSVTSPNPLNFAFFDALRSLGVPTRADLNGGETEGMALRQLSIRGGTRETTASAMLRPAMSRPNLTVLTHARATRILLEDRRATAVEAIVGGGAAPVAFRARREIVLCAGSVHSPQLLMLSGIGDGEHLRSVGIERRHQLAGVGRNLHDHLASPVHMATDESSSYGISSRAMPRNLVNIAEYLLLRQGPIANNIFESAAFVKSVPGLDRPDVQLVFQPARRPPPSFPFPIGHGYATSPVGLYPRSRGRITLGGPDPLAAPVIDPNLLSVAEDVQPLVRGIRLIRRIFASPPFGKYRAHEAVPGREVESEEDLIAYIRAQAYTVHHPVSTCRMGAETDAGAVVDSQLRVIGLEGLRVADASVFPSIIGGNTNAVVVMVAEKAADMVLGRTPLPAAALEASAVEPAAVS